MRLEDPQEVRLSEWKFLTEYLKYKILSANSEGSYKVQIVVVVAVF